MAARVRLHAGRAPLRLKFQCAGACNISQAIPAPSRTVAVRLPPTDAVVERQQAASVRALWADRLGESRREGSVRPIRPAWTLAGRRQAQGHKVLRPHVTRSSRSHLVKLSSLHGAVPMRQKQEDLIGTSAHAAAISRRCLMMPACACLPNCVRHS